MTLIILGIAVVAAAAGALGAVRRSRGDRGDIPARIVDGAARLLAADRAEWGRAMVGELAQHEGRARWHFALGCVVAALTFPRRGGSRWAVGSVLGAAIASAALVGYGFVRYPGMVTGPRTWVVLGAFALTLVGFVVITSVATREPRAAAFGLVAGCATAATWAVVGFVALSVHSKGSVFLLLALPLLSVLVGAVAARRGQTRTMGRPAALVSAVVGALVVFLGLAGNTLVSGGRPYDAGQIQDFATSGYPDMATYAVSDNLGTAMVLLLMMAVLNGAFGVMGSAWASRRGQ